MAKRLDSETKFPCWINKREKEKWEWSGAPWWEQYGKQQNRLLGINDDKLIYFVKCRQTNHYLLWFEKDDGKFTSHREALLIFYAGREERAYTLYIICCCYVETNIKLFLSLFSLCTKINFSNVMKNFFQKLITHWTSLSGITTIVLPVMNNFYKFPQIEISMEIKTEIFLSFQTLVLGLQSTFRRRRHQVKWRDFCENIDKIRSLLGRLAEFLIKLYIQCKWDTMKKWVFRPEKLVDQRYDIR